MPTVATARVLRAALLVVAIGMPGAVARADELQDVSKLVSAGRLIEAENRADAYLEKTPKDAQMRFLKGVILSQKNQRDDAVAVFTALTQDFPELPEPYNNLAVIYAAKGEYDKARDALELAVRVSPRYATAHENLGDVYAALAARSYQDARRYDGSNAAALRKLNAERALLTGSVIPASVTVATPAAAAAPATATPPAAEVVRTQRNVGLPQPAAPAATTVGFGADAPEIVLPSTETSMPRGNVVGYEASPNRTAVQETSTLPGVTTQVASDPAVASPQAIADVTAAVRRWAAERSLRTDGLRIRVDGDTAVARFPETSLATGKAASNRVPTRVVTHVLTLRSSGTAWTVTEALTES